MIVNKIYRKGVKHKGFYECDGVNSWLEQTYGGYSEYACNCGALSEEEKKDIKREMHKDYKEICSRVDENTKCGGCDSLLSEERVLKYKKQKGVLTKWLRKELCTTDYVRLVDDKPVCKNCDYLQTQYERDEEFYLDYMSHC